VLNKNSVQFSSVQFAEGLVNRLQSVQNAAARLVTGTRRSDHITPVLHQLHWFVVRQHVHFKVATLVHRSLSGISPSYLADDCSCLVADARERRLAYVPQRAESALWRRHTAPSAMEHFAAAGPGLWNSFPYLYNRFRRSL